MKGYFFFIILGIGLFIVFFIFLIKYLIFKRFLLRQFKNGNVIVAGKKGKGKDLLFQWVINHRKDFYYANISYGGDRKVIKLKDVTVYPNTYLTFLQDNIVKSKHLFKEGKDIYISDIGNFLPSYMDAQLYKQFPSMPIFYSLSRHLYDSNIHCNTQSIERGWKALREQADFYIQVKGTTKLLGFIFITRMITYDRYESAKQKLKFTFTL